MTRLKLSFHMHYVKIQPQCVVTSGKQTDDSIKITFSHALCSCDFFESKGRLGQRFVLFCVTVFFQLSGKQTILSEYHNQKHVLCFRPNFERENFKPFRNVKKYLMGSQRPPSVSVTWCLVLNEVFTGFS